MSKNKGHPYEKLTQQIFSEILNRDEVTNIEVRHDVTLTGITTNHQIDVYFIGEYAVRGLHLTAA
jgi:hypothetical protein